MRYVLIAVLFFFILPQNAIARFADPSPSGAKPPEPDVIPAIGAVHAAGNHTPTDRPNELELGDVIVITIPGLQEWAARRPLPLSGASASPPRDPWKLVLNLEGRPMVGIPVEVVRGDEISFRLRQNPENRALWASLLAPNATAAVVSVGVAGGNPFPSTKQVMLVRYSQSSFVVGVAGFVALFVLFVVLARTSNMLHDGDSSSKARPYSLARCQMALWFFTILGAFIFLRIVTKCWDVIPNEVLALFGISLATGVGAAVLDSSKTSTARAELIKLEGVVAPTPEQLQHSAELKTSLNGASRTNWLYDILSDADGVSFHRFQMFAWTLVLWVMFMAEVWQSLAMPLFSNQLLGLLGISGGTYLGFKFPERKA